MTRSLLLAGVFALLGAQPTSPESRARAYVAEAGGTLKVAEDRPGRPVVAVNL